MLIHFVHGEKGGVGKSWFCRLLVDYCMTKGSSDIVLVESDSSNPDVGRYYPSIRREIFFSEDDKRSYDVDQIFKLSECLPVIVNLPAQVDAPLNDWIKRNGLVDEDFEDLLIYKWFVCTGEPDSIDLFKKSVTALSGKIKHILVKNMGVTGTFESNWKRWEASSELSEFVESQKVLVMTLDPLHRSDADMIVVSQLTFEEAISPKSKVERLAKRRLRIYRDKVFDAIAEVKLPRKKLLPLGEFADEQEKELISLVGAEVFIGHTDYEAFKSLANTTDSVSVAAPEELAGAHLRATATSLNAANNSEDSSQSSDSEADALTGATEGEKELDDSSSNNSKSSKSSKRSKTKEKSDTSDQPIPTF